jgi:hypothetical protein
MAKQLITEDIIQIRVNIGMEMGMEEVGGK